MKKCPDCGKEMSDELYFCSACGYRLSGREPKTHCQLPEALRILEKKFELIHYAELICPGVYHMAAKVTPEMPYWTAEYLVVLEDSPVLSPEARAYGTVLPEAPHLLLYECEYDNKGRHVAGYEVHQYLVDHNVPLPENWSLLADKVFGMEVCPEYFGEFPVPTETPWGLSLRHQRLWNGLYWLETAEVGWVLAVAYPLCSDIWESTLRLASMMEYDRENGIDNTCGYRFFTYRSSCLPIYEMLLLEKDTWGAKIDKAALYHAVMQNFPRHLEHEPSILCLEIEQQTTPGAGTEFYHFSQDK